MAWATGAAAPLVAEGNEIGNHSYTHPNMADESDTGIKLELNATQRLIEAYTGRSTRLFRAPYFGDAEPTTTDELGPALVAQQQGYTIVGLHADPGDWVRAAAPTRSCSARSMPCATATAIVPPT
jgi:peptidoglycan/xylan/chitin deacetylase (PgdA/CDA1 family)